MADTSFINQAAIVTLPAGWTGAAPPVLPQAITGTGSTEAAQSVALNTGHYYRIVNNGASVARYAGAQASGLSNVVGAAHPVLPVGAYVDFFCTTDTRFVYAEAADGASAYALTVFQNDVYRQT